MDIGSWMDVVGADRMFCQILWLVAFQPPIQKLGRPPGERLAKASAHSLKSFGEGFSLGKIKLDHFVSSGRLVRYCLSIVLPPASKMSE